MRMKTNDGTPDAVKIACPVWNGGKGGDNLKTLPIIIGRKVILFRTYRLHLVRSPRRRKELYHPA